MQQLAEHIAAVEAQIERIRPVPASEDVELDLDLDELRQLVQRSGDAYQPEIEEHIGFMEQTSSPCPKADADTSLKHLRGLLRDWERRIAPPDRDDSWSEADLVNVHKVCLWFMRYDELAQHLCAALEECLGQKRRDRCPSEGREADGCCDLHRYAAELSAHAPPQSFRLLTSGGSCVPVFGKDASYPDLVPQLQTAKPANGWEPLPTTNFLKPYGTVNGLCGRLKGKRLKRFAPTGEERTALRMVTRYLSPSVIAPMKSMIREYQHMTGLGFT